MDKPLLLVTNDDGVHAPGIRALAAALERIGLVHIVAPDREVSACAQSLTLKHPLRAEKLEDRVHAVDGTPADCVNLALVKLLPRRPEVVIGWHWASPPVVMRLAEIVRTDVTNDATVDIITGIAARCDKNPVVVHDTTSAWGFVANRVYFAMIQEANRVVDEGVATREQVDALMVDCFNWPVGPYGMTRGATSGWDS